MPTCRVVHCKHEDYDIYIGRPSKWGNPFVVGRDGTRSEVVQKYKDYILSQIDRFDLSELAGKTLGCWCSPKPCHGDVLAELVNSGAHHKDGDCRSDPPFPEASDSEPSP